MSRALPTIRPRRPPPRRALPDPRTAVADGFCGLPVLSDTPCAAGCRACLDACPTGAIERDGAAITLDLGRCVFCRECEAACPEGKVTFGSEHRLASGSRGGLVLGPSRRAPDPPAASAELRRRYGHSLKLRRVVFGACDGCDGELRACADGHFDMGRWGIDWVATARNADGLVVSGPRAPTDDALLRRKWAMIGGPKLLIAVGACAVSGGLYRAPSGEARGFFEEVPPDLLIPGCPPHPLAFIHGVLELLGI